MAKNEERSAVTLRLQGTQHPVLYEVNTRVLLHELSQESGDAMTLADIPDRIVDEWCALGIDAVWLMGVWTTGALGRQLALDTPDCMKNTGGRCPT
ncbi:MAG: hypothetical protein IPI01_10115 [Ignavibacteriae bacterium]|nr:hypothetical protein [Ignavibacteriota bacterium]